mmetsp:Transcript_3342/g.6791  ORF Transcript_3342/g.6791 Transcript_3342/m.6791 type:complete len:174 (-) Transcript_3342:44-565(-)
MAMDTTASRAVAKAFLHAHDDPSSDDLTELKTGNPMAYGIVMGLLKKRQMGMPLSKYDADHKDGNVLPASASGSSDESSVEEVSTGATKRHDWFNWKPTSDAAVVESAQADAGFLSKSKSESTVSSAEEDAIPGKINFDWSYHKKEEAPQAAPVESKASADVSDDNSYAKYFK